MKYLSKKEISSLTDKELREILTTVLEDLEKLKETVVNLSEELKVREKKISEEEEKKFQRMTKKVMKDLVKRGRLFLLDQDYLITDGKMLIRIKDPSVLENFDINPEDFHEIPKDLEYLEESIRNVYDSDRPFTIKADDVLYVIGESGILRTRLPNGIIWKKLENGPCIDASLYTEGLILSKQGDISCGINPNCPIFMEGDLFETYIFPRKVSSFLTNLEPGFYGWDKGNRDKVFRCEHGKIREIEEDDFCIDDDLER